MSIGNPGKVHVALALLGVTNAAPAAAEPPCSAASNLSLLTIAEIESSVVPVIDKWQVLWRGVVLSDAQVARLAGDEALILKTHEEMEDRGTWVFVGMGIAAAGAAVSSAGWVLYGQNDLSQGITVPLAIGGLLVGIVGFMIVTRSIQSPLEPHLAPTPQHRITQDEMGRLVATINGTIFAGACQTDAGERARYLAIVGDSELATAPPADATDTEGAAAASMTGPSP